MPQPHCSTISSPLSSEMFETVFGSVSSKEYCQSQCYRTLEVLHHEYMLRYLVGGNILRSGAAWDHAKFIISLHTPHQILGCSFGHVVSVTVVCFSVRLSTRQYGTDFNAQTRGLVDQLIRYHVKETVGASTIKFHHKNVTDV
ncbi:hypothetical protein Bca4012_019602 [Brassica carinata]